MVNLNIEINNFGECFANVHGDDKRDILTAWVNLSRLVSQTTGIRLADMENVLDAYVSADKRNARANNILRGVSSNGKR